MPRRPLHRLAADASGATSVEYGLLGALVAVAAAGALVAVGSGVGDVFERVEAGLVADPRALPETTLVMEEAPDRPPFTPVSGEAPAETPGGADAPREAAAPDPPRAPPEPALVPAALIPTDSPPLAAAPAPAGAPPLVAATNSAPQKRPSTATEIEPAAALEDAAKDDDDEDDAQPGKSNRKQGRPKKRPDA